MPTKQRNTDKDPYAGIVGADSKSSILEHIGKSDKGDRKKLEEIEQPDAVIGGAEVPPQHVHNRKHRLRGDASESRKDNNPFHNDEAFEEFQMGREAPSKMPISNKNEVKGSYQATKLNHHSRGTAKERAEDSLRSYDWPV